MVILFYHDFNKGNKSEAGSSCLQSSRKRPLNVGKMPSSTANKYNVQAKFYDLSDGDEVFCVQSINNEAKICSMSIVTYILLLTNSYTYT